MFHPSVLEPDLDLRLVELESGRDLDPPRPRQVFVEVELFLQLGQLFGGKVGPASVVGSAEAAAAAVTAASSSWASHSAAAQAS